ncbi:BspA family leucine-rich repeat surface protein [Bifidobacterium sp.]|uniref:BspA family leucine-rich repeat surface protein n=1 Tax=Bifidobacterium sp. TaxID=41200 RepID=UPI0039EAFB6E
MVRGAFGRVVLLLGACVRALSGRFLRSRGALHASRVEGAALGVGSSCSPRAFVGPVLLRSLRARWLVTVAVSWVALVVGVVGLVQVSSFFSDLRSLVAFQDTLLKTSVPLDVKNLKLDTHIGVLEDDDPMEAQADAASVANVGFERLVLSDVATLSFDVAYGGDPGDGVANMQGSMIKVAWGDPDDALPVRGYFYLYPSNWTAASIRNDVNNGANASLNKAADVTDLPMNDGDVYAQGQTFLFQSTDDFLVHPSDVDLVDADPDNDRSSQTFSFKVAFVRDYAAGGDGNSQLQTDFMQFDGRRLHLDVSANSRLGMNHKELELKAKITPTMIAGTTGEPEATKYWGNAALNITKGSTETVTYVDAASTTALDSSGKTFAAAGGAIDPLTEAITVPTSWNGMSVLGSWDVSLAKDQTAMTFYTDSKAGTANKHDLYVAGRQGVLASNANSLFHSFRSISFDLGLLDVCESEDMRYMFYNVQMVRNGFFDISHFRTRNTTTMVEMFHYFGDSAAADVRLKHIDMSYGGFADQSKPNVGAWDTSSVVNTSSMFRYVYYVESIDVTGWDLSQKTGIVLNNMFENAQRLKTLAGLGTWKTDGVSSTANMFLNWATQVATFTEADVLDLGADTTNGYWNVSRLTAANGMFSGATRIRSIDVTGWDLSTANARSTITTAGMFQNTNMLSKLIGIDSWKTGGIRYTNAMFQNWCNNAVCAGVTLDLHAQGSDVWDTSKVESTNAMFAGATYVTQLDVTGWQTVKVTNMAAMFQSTSRLNSLIGVTDFNTGVVTTMNAMFSGWCTDASCAGITLDLHTQAGSVWDTTKVTDASNMFNNANKVVQINVTGWDFSTANSRSTIALAAMFQSTTMLKTMPGISMWNTDGVANMSSMFNAWATGISDFAGTATAGSCDLNIPHNALNGYWNVSRVTNASSMFNNANKVKSIDVTGWTFTAMNGANGNVNLSSMFQSTAMLKTPLGISSWNTTGVFTTASMFNGWATGVTDFVDTVVNLDLATNNVSNWNVSNVTSFDSMFRGASKAKKVDLTGWDTSKVTTMANMFYGAHALQYILGISDFEMLNVTNVSSMFREWGNSVTFDGSSVNLDIKAGANGVWDLTSLTSANAMFYQANRIRNIDVTGWQITRMSGTNGGVDLARVFFETFQLKTITGVSGWDVSGAHSIMQMFYRWARDVTDFPADSSYKLDLGAWDVSNVTTFDTLFYQSTKVNRVNVSGWDTGKATNMVGMFHTMSALEQIDLSSFTTDNVTDMNYMFHGDDALTTLDLSTFDTSKVTNMSGMFMNSRYLKEIKVGSSFVIGASTNVTNMVANLALNVTGYTGKWFRDLHPTDLDLPANIFKQNTTVAQGTWYAEHTVSLTLDGNYAGKPADPVKAIKYGDVSVPSFVKPTRTGYVFEGYWTGKGAADGEVTGSQVVSDAGAYVDAAGYVSSGIGWTRYADTTLYAKWSEATYSITVNLTRLETTAASVNVWLDSEGLATDTAYAGATYKATAGTGTSFVISGVPYSKTKGMVVAEYTTAGTYNLTTGTHAATSTGADADVTVATYASNVTANQTHALKIAQLYSITYARSTTPSAATGTLPSTQLKIHNTNLTLGTNNSTVTGYTKNGWKTNADNTGTAYANGASYTTNAALSLYEGWTANTNLVTLNNQSATTAGSASFTATYDSAAPALTAPTRTGHAFGGYYTATDGGGVQVLTDAMAYPTTATDYVTSGKWSRATTGGVTLYAKWTTVVVSFKSYDGASDVMTAVNVAPGSNYTLPAAPAVTNRVFLGWAESANSGRGAQLYTEPTNAVRTPLNQLDKSYIGSSKGTELTNVTANKTLYAVYLKTLAGTSTPSASAPTDQEFIWANAIWRVLAVDGTRRLVLKASYLSESEMGLGSGTGARAVPFLSMTASGALPAGNALGQRSHYYFDSDGSNGYEDSGLAADYGLKSWIDYYYNHSINPSFAANVVAVTLNNPDLGAWNSALGLSWSHNGAGTIAEPDLSDSFAATVGTGTKQAFALSTGDINASPGMGLHGAGTQTSTLLSFSGANSDYWLRTAGYNFPIGGVIWNYNGAYGASGYDVDWTSGVFARPALWLTL